MIDAALADTCAAWWSERFLLDEKREAFRAELARRLAADEISDSDRYGLGVRLIVDYDPQGTLLEIVRGLGIECRGFMFSADGVLLCKRRMKIRKDGTVEVEDGRVPPVALVAGPPVAAEPSTAPVAQASARAIRAAQGAIAARFHFADGHSELVDLPAHEAHARHCMRPIMTAIHVRAVVFARRELAFPPDFIGPLESGDVVVEHDSPHRAAMVRDLGEDAVHRGLGRSVEGWRIVAVFVEAGAPRAAAFSGAQ
jgi:hypothetical protein